ncbi:hypothetical protein OIO90_003196 [Microbotryomycetes sp. JL221]|nr:hypothetical protein OIO90_003196 [Microbotryomycetes sp. JL221]
MTSNERFTAVRGPSNHSSPRRDLNILRMNSTSSVAGAIVQTVARSTMEPIRRRMSTSTATTTLSGATDLQQLLAQYSQQPSSLVKLTDLTRYGEPPLSEADLLDSAERTRQSLLVGLAKRVTQHLSLPFLPATNPSLQTIHNLYSTAFVNLVNLKPIKTLQDNDRLCDVVTRMVEAHRDNIPILAKGFQETKKYLPEDTITQFLDRAIKLRISLRLMAEQHLSLSSASLPALPQQLSSSSSSSAASSSASDAVAAADPRVEPSARPPTTTATRRRIGVLDLDLKPRDIIGSCAEFVTLLCESTYGVSPGFVIQGQGADEPVGAVASHLEYILTELLKNAFRATVEFNAPKREKVDDGKFRFEDLPHAHLMKEDLPPVVITVGVVKGVLTIRIRDRGGGVFPNLPDPDFDPDSPQSSSVASEQHLPSSDLYGGVGGAGYYGGVGGGPPGAPGESALQTSMGTLAGLGFGLPLSRIYSGYFGGSMDLVSMYGFGTDLYVVLPVVQLRSKTGELQS